MFNLCFFRVKIITEIFACWFEGILLLFLLCLIVYGDGWCCLLDCWAVHGHFALIHSQNVIYYRFLLLDS